VDLIESSTICTIVHPYFIRYTRHMTKPQKLKGTSVNPQEELLALLQAKCPEVFSDGKVDVKKLKATLGESVDGNGERYGLAWAGKNDCFRHIQEPTTATLKPMHAESADFDTTKNIFIEGDNLQVLKALQKSYYGKVKMMYIDPPYNTGGDSFIYPDRFQESKEEYMERIGQKEEGHLTREGMWQKNSSDNGHYHSNWLSMMYPRLFLARNLLRQDGVIFVSIDDVEIKNLRAILDEIFGENNFIAQVVWEKIYTTKNDSAQLSNAHEYILIYAKDIISFELQLLPRTEEMDARYSNPDNDKRGHWKPIPLYAKGERKNGRYTIISPTTGKQFTLPPNKHWLYREQDVLEMIKDNRIWFGKDGNGQPNVKRFLSEVQQGLKARTLWKHDEVGSNDSAKREFRTLFDDKGDYFDFPKPTTLIFRMLQIATKTSDLIMDFFTGSGTTAHAVMALNAEDDGSRQCISVQLDEKCDESSEAKKAGFNTIADIARERIRRAAKKIKEETGAKIDYGFKAFKLDDSNFKIWRSDVGNADALAKQMEMFIDNVKKDSTQENILVELTLKTGLDLNTPTEKVEDKAGAYFKLNGGKLIVCIQEGIAEALSDKVLTEKPEKFICLDKAFGGNDQLKTNVLLQMEQAGVDFLVI